MSNKTILHITSHVGYNSVFSPQYTIISEHINFDIPPYTQAQLIIRSLNKKHITPSGVFGQTDATSILASYIAQELSLPHALPHALYLAQNKSVFNTLLHKSFPKIMPKTEILNKKNTKTQLSFPLYIRPAKGSFSKHSYIISSQTELDRAISSCEFNNMDNIKWYDAFFRNQAQGKKYVPPDSFIAQELIIAPQYTVDALIRKEKAYIIGITSSILTPKQSTFIRFDYPAKLGYHVIEHIKQSLITITRLIGYNNSACNMEFFIKPNGDISIIEFNTRISPQFIPLFSQHYRHSPFDMLLELARGNKPNMKKKISFPYISSFPLKVFEDKHVVKIPSNKYRKILLSDPHIVNFHIDVKSGTKMSDYRHDEYSYRYGVLDIAGDSSEDIFNTYRQCMKDNVGFILQPIT